MAGFNAYLCNQTVPVDWNKLENRKHMSLCALKPWIRNTYLCMCVHINICTHTPYAYKYICKEPEEWAWAGIQKNGGPAGFLQDRSVLVSGLFFECTPCLCFSCSPSFFAKSKKANDLPFPASYLYLPGWAHSPRKRIAWSPNQTQQAVDPPQTVLIFNKLFPVPSSLSILGALIRRLTGN